MQVNFVCVLTGSTLYKNKRCNRFMVYPCKGLGDVLFNNKKYTGAQISSGNSAPRAKKNVE